ncbi:glycosyltransferase [Hyphomicrobium sp. 2TAF46]|uniref:glycosyltransferase n=1 Tax=Hyphomicrobium sp. 2TAF46 TaxID=3233019 RepID=UPI003F902AD2
MALGSVNIVTSDRGWILEKLASELTQRLPYVRHRDAADPSASIQYYITYSCRQQRVSPIELAYFAHLEKNEETAAEFFSVARDVDYCVCHSRMYEDVIRDKGIENVISISPGVDLDQFVPRVKIGVVGRTYHTGRKGESLVQQVMDIPGIEWHFTGDGWPGPAEPVPGNKLCDFYNGMDYVLVPAFYEGGPMCVVEALACGVPVIASPVGWVGEFPHIAFKNGDAGDLRRVLEQVVSERAALRHAVLDRTWDAWAEGHDKLFQSLLKEHRPRLHISENGASRDGDVREDLGKVVLLTHGSERHSLGGPTVRVPATADYLRRRGVFAEVRNFPDPAIFEADIVHGFNVWSLESALTMARRSHSLGKPFVFSPIFLDQSENEFWSGTIPQLFAQEWESDRLEAELGLARAAFEHARELGRTSTEAAPGHHAYVREMVRLADQVICLSEHEQRALRRIGADVEISTIVRNPVDADRFGQADPSIFADAFGFKDYVVCVGRIESRKNQLMLIQALSGLNIPVVLIGAISDKKYGEKIHRRAGDNIHFTGRIDPSSPLIASALAGARVSVLPSWCEGAPLAALEAAAAGASMVLSNRSSEPEYFGDLARYCDPADLGSIRDTILEAYEAPLDASRREEQKDYVARNFSWERYAEQTHQVYQKAVRDFAAKGHSSFQERVAAEPDDRRSPNENDAAELSSGHIVFDVTTSANHKGRWTGIARFEMALASHLIKTRRDTVSFVAWHDPTQKFVIIDHNAILSCDVGSNLALAGKRGFQIPKFTAGTRLFVGGSAWMQNSRYADALGDFCASAGLALTVAFHDIVPVKFPHWFNEGYAPKFIANLKVVLANARDILAVSENTKRDVEDFAFANGLFLPTIRILREGDDFGVLSSTSAGHGQSSLIEALKEQQFVLAVGAIHARKNYGLLYNVWARLAEKLGKKCPKLVIVGGVAWNGTDVARAFKEDPRTASIVHVIDNIEDDLLNWLYEHCLFTAYPSFYEGWGLPVAESLARGKICIASNSSSIPEVGGQLADLIDPLDFAAWYAKVLFYCGSKSARDLREAQIKEGYVNYPWSLAADGFAKQLTTPLSELVVKDGYLPGTLVDVGSPARPDVNLVGWFNREAWGVWSAKTPPVLVVSLRSPLTADALLLLHARALASYQMPVTCAVEVDGKHVATLQFDTATVRLCSVPIPKDLVRNKLKITISFHVSRLVPISSVVAKSADDRPVGIGLSKFALLDASHPFAVMRYAAGPDDVLNSVDVGDELDLRLPEVARRVLGPHVKTDSAWGARNPGADSKLKLEIHRGRSGDIDLDVRFRAVASSDMPVSAVIVAEGGEVVGRLEAADSNLHWTTIRIPEKLMVSARPLILDVLRMDMRSPNLLGVGSDEEEFTLGIFGIRLRSIDGVAAEPKARLYPFGRTIELSDAVPTEASFILPSTWHLPEPQGRWTLGESGCFDLRLQDDVSPEAEIEIVAAVPGELIDATGGPSLAVEINGSEIVRQTRTHANFEAIRARIPSEQLAEGSKSLRIQLSTDRTFVPARAGESKDDRVLGVLVRSLSVVPGRVCNSDIAAANYEIGDTLAFGRKVSVRFQRNAGPFLSSETWHDAEVKGRWTNGVRGSFLLRPEALSERDLVIEVMAGIGAGALVGEKRRELSLRINDVEIARQTRHNGRVAVIGGVIPRSLVEEASAWTIDIEIDRSFQPSEALGSTDQRALGVFVSQCRILDGGAKKLAVLSSLGARLLSQ